MFNASKTMRRSATLVLTTLAPQWAQAQAPQPCADLQWGDGMARAGQIQKYFSASVVFVVIFLIVGACFPARTFAQKLQPYSSCGTVSDNNSQFYVTSGLAKRANCWDSWGSGKEYQLVVMQVPKGRPYGITEYTNSSPLHSNSLSWSDDPNKPDEFHLQTPAVGYGVMQITSDQLPAWAINLISDNRDIFEYLIQKTNLVLPSLQDDPKTVGRGARGA